jgi:hypothetical protein
VVISDEQKYSIEIAINIASRVARELLNVIRFTIKDIINDKAKYTEQVPLMLNEKIVGFADYDFLIGCKRKGWQQVPLPIEIDGKPETEAFELSYLLDGYSYTSKPRFDYQKLTSDLVSIMWQKLQSNHAINKESEDETNDRIRDALKDRGYKVTDQTRGGRSGTGKKAGEKDFAIFDKFDNEQSVIEALILNSACSRTIISHYEKLQKRYDPIGHFRNFVLIYAKAKNFNTLWESYAQLFSGFADISGMHGGKANLKVGLTVEGEREVCHIMTNFYV